MNKSEAKRKYFELKKPPKDAQASWYRERGRQLEKILNSLFEQEKLYPRTNYRPDGEEIDGSLIWNNKYFLVEAKWHKDPIPASTLYAFKGKVDGKLVGTIGIFISISNYSKDAIDALLKGKELNLILFDEEDIDNSLKITGGFTKILANKLRAAAEEGTVYYKDNSVQLKKIKTKYESKEIETIKNIDNNTIFFICEGKIDEVILQELLIRLMSKYLTKLHFRIVTAGGKYNLSKIANIVAKEKPKKIYIIADSDNDTATTNYIIRNGINTDIVDYIILEPNIEAAWLKTTKKDFYSNLEYPKNIGSDTWSKINKFVNNIDIEELSQENEGLMKIINEFD